MSGFGWDYPPGVTGNEPQITGEWPCVNCGRTLPEEAECPECGEPMVEDDHEWTCTACDHTEASDTCPGGCYEPNDE